MEDLFKDWIMQLIRVTYKQRQNSTSWVAEGLLIQVRNYDYITKEEIYYGIILYSGDSL